MVVGICVGETSLSEVTFISNKMPKVGEYVTIEYEEYSGTEFKQRVYMNSFMVLFQVETLDSPAFECSVLLTASERVKNVVFQENPP